MKQNLILVKLDYKYCDYLRKHDNRVPYNYGTKELRPFIGVLFKINNYMYFAPLSSPKDKHTKLKNKLDLLKIDGGKLGIINFNNMLPVKKNNIIKIDLEKSGQTLQEKKYNKLLKEQLFWLNRHSEKIYSKSYKLYTKYLDKTIPKNMIDRCCNFKLLEKKCEEYVQNIK